MTNTPARYKLLSVFVEYPIESGLQIEQLYFSTYHWKRIVTGASAFPSRTYIELVQPGESVPSPATLRDFERIGVRYLVVHERPSDDITAEELRAAMELLTDRLRLVETFDSYDVSEISDGELRVMSGGRARIYELTKSESRPPQLVRSPPERAGAQIFS